MSGTIKLRLSELGIYGRDEELSILRGCYHRVAEKSCDGDAAAGGADRPQVVLVAGGAGTGKSTLVTKLGEEVKGRAGTFFISGKFDDPRATTGQPYSALRAAFGDLVDGITESCDETERKQIGKAIDDVVGSDGLEVLERLAPGIQKLVMDGDEKREGAAVSNVADARRPTVDSLNQLTFAIRSFLRSVCSSSHPVVLFLDDLQWADQASLQLLRSMITDAQLRHLLFVGAYRDEEVDEASHPLPVMLREAEDDSLVRSITRIETKPLDLPTVSSLVSSLLRPEDAADVDELSEIVHQRTGGNAFFVLQFLDMLQKTGLLVYDLLIKYQWTWDVETIRSQTVISENVVEFVAQKLQRLPQRVTAVLKLMACFPSTTVNLPFLGAILKGLDLEEFRDDVNASDLVLVLDEASDEGLVDKIGSDSYRFTHDRVREGAYSLIHAGQERDTFHRRIGALVLEMLATAPVGEEQWMKFVAADQLNHGVAYIMDEKQKKDLVALNLEAGKAALAISAFVPAFEFFDKGIMLLRADKEHWKSNYDLSLKMYSSAVETAHCTGDFERHRQLMEEVLANAECLRDKLPVYCSLVESLTAQQKLEEATDIGFQVLAKLGQCFPKRFLLVHFLADFRKTKKMLRRYSDDDLVSLPPLEDPDVRFAVRIMVYLARCTFFLQRLESMLLLMLRQLQLAVEYGANGDTPYTYACYGMLLCGGLGDIKEGCRFGKLALKLVEQYHGEEPQVVLVVHSFVVRWQSPVQDQIDPLVRGHKIGMASGDFINGFLCAVGYAYFFYHAGLPLKTLEKDLSAYILQMQEYKQELAYMEVLPLLQGVLNLMGRSSDPLILSGSAIVQEEFLRDTEDRCIPSAMQKVFYVRMQLAYYFGDIGLAEEMMESSEKLMATLSAHLLCEVSTFFCGLIYIEQARRTKKRKYKSKAYSVIVKIRKWVQDRGVNCVHKLWLLEAEYATLSARTKGQKDKIKSAYDSSISAAARSGFLHDAALANERAGIWFRTRGDEFWASSYLERAHGLYREWGAIAKADQLNHQYEMGFVSASENVEHSPRSAKGKARFDRQSSQQHKSISFGGDRTESQGSGRSHLTSGELQVSPRLVS